MARLRTVEAHYAAEGEPPQLALSQVTRWTALGFGLEWRHDVAYRVVGKKDGPGDTFVLADARRRDFVAPWGRAEGREALAQQHGWTAQPFDLQPVLNHCCRHFGLDAAQERRASSVAGAAVGGLLGGGAVATSLRASNRPRGPLAPPSWRLVVPQGGRRAAVLTGAMLGAFVFGFAAEHAQLEASLESFATAGSLQHTQDVVASVADGRHKLRPADAFKWQVQRMVAPQLGGAPWALHQHATAYLQARGVQLEQVADGVGGLHEMLAAFPRDHDDAD